ncbi:hypothetical protein SKAU_G00117270 [Synaphobranchus kaupii]|uniref:Uncharacterized protein n=1 Tax=Synaphobranchus kaupii TaxID=118154 RepID=A0A9Q1FNB4_SYNKA|nr:hypothetical protein SKAU_G00117270 [Synaphobranchus kaupii]
MENSSIPTEEDHRPPTDLGSASLHPSLTAQTGGNTVDQSEQKTTDLRSVPCHSSVTAQTAGNTVLPHISGCHVGGSFHLSVNIQSDPKGVEDRGDGRLVKLLQDVSLGAGAAGSDDITGRTSGAVCSRPVTSGAEREPTDRHESCAGTELGGTQTDAQSQQPNSKIYEAITSDKQTQKSDLKNKFEHHGPCRTPQPQTKPEEIRLSAYTGPQDGGPRDACL